MSLSKLVVSVSLYGYALEIHSEPEVQDDCLRLAINEKKIIEEYANDEFGILVMQQKRDLLSVDI
jgi:hypothetical protein